MTPPNDKKPGKGGSKGAPTGAMLRGRERHLVQRFSYGLTPPLASAVRANGGADAWFERQLTRPGSFADSAAGATRRWFRDLDRSPSELWQRQAKEIRGGWEVMDDYGRWLLVRRIMTNRPVHEKMTEFWESMLHVPVTGDAQFTWRVRYGDAIRTHALGRFDQLLAATVTHPAMLIHLDAASSTKKAPNENLGRELLELFTLGAGNFTEDDVKASSRILTGYRVDMWKTWAASYGSEDHWRGTVKVRGFKHSNRKPDGRGVVKEYLRYLAHHPDTAHRVCERLATKFVQQDPPAGLVRRLAKVYLAHDTAIVPVLRALVASREFRVAADAKTRDPGEDVVATYRAIGARIKKPTGDKSAANVILWQANSVGLTPHGWPRPDGTPVTDDVWSSPARMLASFDLHWAVSGGWWPTAQISYRTATDWVPKKGLKFRDLVDALSKDLLHLPASNRLLETCSRATGCRAGELIDRDHAVAQWDWPRLMTAVLDSPDHFTC